MMNCHQGFRISWSNGAKVLGFLLEQDNPYETLKLFNSIVVLLITKGLKFMFSTFQKPSADVLRQSLMKLENLLDFILNTNNTGQTINGLL